MNRRRFLVTLCVLGASFPARSGPLFDEHCRRQRLHARIARLSHYPASASQIAKVYLNQLQKRHSIAAMLDDFNTIDGCSSPHLLHIGDNELRATFNNYIMKDFEEERTINVDGWLMSETEVFFCALVASHQMQCIDSIF